MNRSESNLDSTEVADGAPPSPLLRTQRGRFVLNGEVVYLVGVGPVALTPSGDHRALVDRLAALSTSVARFWVRLDTWAFCWRDDALSPWARTADGYNLGAFDPKFWNMVADLTGYANERGVLLEIVLFDGLALRPGPARTGWWRNPFNAANGGPTPGSSSARFYQSGGPALEAQTAFVRQAVESLHSLPNVTWELFSSLDGADPVRIAFVSDLIGLLRETDPLDRLVSASIAAPKRTDTALYSLQGIDTAGFDWDDGGIAESSFQETVASLREFGKPVVNNRVVPAADAGLSERKRLEQAIAAGAHTILRPETVGADWLKAAIDQIEMTMEG